MRITPTALALTMLCLGTAGCPPDHDGYTSGKAGKVWFSADPAVEFLSGLALAVGATAIIADEAGPRRLTARVGERNVLIPGDVMEDDVLVPLSRIGERRQIGASL